MKLHSTSVLVRSGFSRSVFCLTASMAMSLASADAAVVYSPETPRILLDFEGMTADQTLSSTGWTSTGAANISAKAPRTGSGGATGNVALQAADSGSASDWVALSPGQTATPAFSLSDTIYFSAYMNRISSLASGSRVLIRRSSDPSTQFLGGFGIVNSGSNYFTAYYDGAWHSTTVSAAANKWYEVALVIQMNAADVSQSLGYLYVRNVTDGGGYELLTSEAGFNMGYSESFNATQFDTFRLANFRNSAQVDNLAAGVIAIPEPSGAALIGGSLLLAGLGRKASKFFQGWKTQGQ